MTSAFSRSLVRSPTSTPKPRAEGRVRASGTQATSRPERERRPSPSAPAKNSATAFAVALFFVMAVGETEARGACRASPPKRRLWRMPFNEEDCICNLPGVGHANSFAVGRRLARRPCRRRQSRVPQEGLRSKFKSVLPFPPCYGGPPLPSLAL